MTADSVNHKLAQAFDFGPAELAANHNNLLTPKQEKLLAQTRRIRGCSTKVAALVGGATGLIFILVLVLVIIPNATGAPWPLLMLPVIIFVILFFGALAFGIYRGRDLNARRISRVAGRPYLAAKKFIGKVGNRMTGYYVTIDRTRFQVATAEQFKAFEPDRSYKVYYIKDPPGHIILSVEVLD